MNKAIYAGLGLLAAATAFGQSEAVSMLAKTTQALNAAQSLKATCSVQVVGGAPTTVNVELAKPNMAVIETPTRLFVADGKFVTTYDKSSKTYYKQAQKASSLKRALDEAGVGIWQAFFNPKADAGLTSVHSLPSVTRHGMDLYAVQFNKPSAQPTTITYYLTSDFLPHQAQIVVKNGGGQETTLLTNSPLVLSGKVDPSHFAFKAPDGSRELSEAEANAGKWYTDFNEALAVAKATNRLVLVDFYTSWCHWCKVLREEVFPKDEFKAMGKYFVFCEIDAEAETGLAQRYGVEAYPTSVFVDGDGNLVHKLVGYKPLNEYVAEMDAARKGAGK